MAHAQINHISSLRPNGRVHLIGRWAWFRSTADRRGVRFSLLPSIRRQLIVCCGVGWTAAGTDRQHRHRVDWMVLTDGVTKTCPKHYRSEILGGGESSNKKWVPGAFSGVRDGRWIRVATLPLSRTVVMKTGSLNFLQPSGPLRTYNVTALGATMKMASISGRNM